MKGIFLPLPDEKVYSGYDPGQVGICLSPIDFDNDGDIDLIGLNPIGYDSQSYIMDRKVWTLSYLKMKHSLNLILQPGITIQIMMDMETPISQ